MRVKPIRNERRPVHPIRWEQPPGTIPHKVQDGDTWITLADKFNVKGGGHAGARYLIFKNFYVDVIHPKNTDEVNWYLREYVGCCESTDGGLNWAFTSKASPGIIYIPIKVFDFEGQGEIIIGSKGIGGDVSVDEYDDHNFYDSLSKSLDIYGAAEMGLGVSEIALPVLLEAGLIVTGAAAAVIGPAIAVGAGHADALKKLSRDHFFSGFSIGLVMSAHGWSKDWITSRHELKMAPANAVYPEKRETFKNLHNYGLLLGIKKGSQFNTVDFKNFFTYLRKRLTERERQDYRGRPREWTERKRKDYYDRLAGIVKEHMLKNDLKFKFTK